MDDIFEFLEDYSSNLISNIDIKIFLQEFYQIIKLMPEMLSKIGEYLYELLQKVYMKLRSKIIFVITNDIDMVDKNHELWIKLNLSKNKNIKIIQILGSRTDILQKKSMYNKIKYLIKNSDKRGFLRYCVEKQQDECFIEIKKQLENISN